MKTFAVFCENGEECCGSDAWFRLDSRNKLAIQIQDALERMQQLSKVRSHFNGFNIRVGEQLSNTKIIFSFDKNQNKSIQR